MSILIKGMEMPKTHPLTVTIYPDGQVLSETVGAKDKHGIAVPVPPHGRFGDLDELEAEMRRKTNNSFCINMICKAPTIIPAEIISENEIKIIDTKGKSNYDPKRRFVISAEEGET